MEKMNKLELIGVVLLAVGGLFWVSEKFYFIAELNSAYSWARIVFYLGLAIWAFGLMKKEADKKKQKENEQKNVK